MSDALRGWLHGGVERLRTYVESNPPPVAWFRRGKLRLVARYDRGGGTAFERFLIRQWVGLRTRFGMEYVAKSHAVLWAGSNRRNRIGIYLKGACDLSSVFAAAPMIREGLDGVCCIMREKGEMSTVRSDILLQSLEELPRDRLEEISERLSLPLGYFEPRLFDPTFSIPGFGEFPKTVIVLSAAADVLRTVYRHRESGLLVDPGGWWLEQSMDRVLANLSTVRWFRENFEKIGRLSIEESHANLGKVIETLQRRTSAHIIVFNTLMVEPGSTTHSYQLIDNPMTVRLRRFDLSLIELSRALDFSIIDVDRILKREGIREQVDFGHFTPERFRPVAEELHRILVELEVISDSPRSRRTATASSGSWSAPLGSPPG